MRRALGQQAAGWETPYNTLYNHWKDFMKSLIGVDVEPDQFPAGNETLRNLWGQVLYEDEEIPQITEQQVQDAIDSLSNGTAPGYDGLTGEHWKCCDTNALKGYMTCLIQYTVNQGTVLPNWKIGVITFLPKPVSLMKHMPARKLGDQ